MAARIGEDEATVLVTVKTYPNPSESYGETVCVAGVRTDRETPEWIRLYPVKFRNTDFGQQFRKYELIRVPGTYQQGNDNRPESFRPRQDALEHLGVVDTKKNWGKRKDLIGDLVGGVTSCELLRLNPKGAMSTPAPSLGLVRPVDVTVEITDGDPWTPDEIAKIEQASAPDLFGTSIRPLEPAPFAVRYRYKCETSDCNGHRQKVLDWEVGQAGRRWVTESGHDRAREMMRETWEDKLLAPDRDVHFYIGNQARRRQSFSVLGVWYPRSEEPPAEVDPVLF